MSAPRLRVLAVTNLFPNNLDPAWAPFNRLQLAALARHADVEVRAVVPWRFGRYYGGARTSAGITLRETIDGLPVTHPRYPSLPGVPSLNALLLAASLFPGLALDRLARRFDAILAAYAYPDGCAGVMLGALLRLPVIVKCHGSDLNRVPRDAVAKKQLELWLPRADAVVCVSQRLAERAAALGVRRDHIDVVYNGVDRARFSVRDRGDARRRLGLPVEQPLVVFVGHLAEHKGVRDLLAAVPILARSAPPTLVAFVGAGPLARDVEEAAERGPFAPSRILAVGRVAHDEVADWITAADVLCLPSWDEGLPNVVREAHVSGRPVVATSVGGIPEIVHRPELGRLVPPRDPEALAAAIADLVRGPPVPPDRIAELASVPTWDDSARALADVITRAVRRERRAPERGAPERASAVGRRE
ncbi:glycosyltransferase [Myxococcota bacterium]|nr:glycosyltransferase [Myxococcota bacterium]